VIPWIQRELFQLWFQREPVLLLIQRELMFQRELTFQKEMRLDIRLGLLAIRILFTPLLLP
jgi:hypothetical protein